MDVTARREVHDRVGPPAYRPHHLLDFLGDARTHRRIADVGVHLDKEVAADRHRLKLDVVDVGRNDGAAARHLAANEFRRHELRNLGSETLAVGDALLCLCDGCLTREILAMGHINHFLGDDPSACEFVLGHELPLPCGAQRASCGTERRETVGGDDAVVLRTNRAALDRGITSRRDPGLAHRLKPVFEVDSRRVLRVRSRRIVDPNRRLIRVAKGDLAERYANVQATFGRSVYLARAGDRPSGDASRRGEFGCLVHGRLLALNHDGRDEATDCLGVGCVPSPA